MKEFTMIRRYDIKWEEGFLAHSWKNCQRVVSRSFMRIVRLLYGPLLQSDVMNPL